MKFDWNTDIKGDGDDSDKDDSGKNKDDGTGKD